MKRKVVIYKAILAIAVALAFVMPSAVTFANGTPNVENTNDMIEPNIDNTEESYTDIPVIISSDINTDPYGQYKYYDDGEDSFWYYEAGIADQLDWANTASAIDTASYNEALPIGDTIYVDDDADPSWYDATHVKTIQEGVNNASAGDVVYVYNGTYYEKVTVNKQLDLIGESRENVIVDWNEECISIAANNVNIDGFTATNGTMGIVVAGVSNSSISNCNLYGNDKGKGTGFFAVESPNTNITNCEVYNNVAYGIVFTGCSNGNIIECNVYDNGGNGLMFTFCPNISVISCNLYHNEYAGMGISTSEDSIITDNEIYGNGRDGMLVFYTNAVAESNYYLRNNTIYDVSSGYSGLVVLGSLTGPRTWHNDIDTTNTINGKSIYYLSERVNDVFDFASIDVGYLALADCTNVTIKNGIFSNNYDGIVMAGGTHGSLITDCTFSDNYDGIWIYAGAHSNEITNCNIFNNVRGVRVQEIGPITIDESNVIRNCNIYNNSGFGFWTQCSMYNSIIGCDIYGNGYAYTQEISGQTWWPYSLQNGGPGVMIHFRTSNNLVENCTIHDNYEGIFVFDTLSAGQFRNNELYGNTDFGPNKCKASGHGLCIHEGFATIDNCNSHDNRYGIYIGEDGTTMKDCVMNDNTYNFGLGGCDSIEIYSSNMINGKPMLHVVGESDLVFDETDNLGWLWLDSCTDITVENLDIEGILLTYTTDSTLSDVTVHSSTRGIYLFYSPGNTVVNCEAYNNAEMGIALYYSDDCIVTGCTVHDNAEARIYDYPAGLYFSACENITLEDCEVYNHYPDFTTGFFMEQTGYGVYFGGEQSLLHSNTVHDNEWGIYCDIAGYNNTLIHNNIANNNYNAFDDAEFSNSWNNGYPSGGNFWGDYDGIDEYSGPDQDISGSDGIGDTPYVIEGGPEVNQDNYPFMDPIHCNIDIVNIAGGIGVTATIRNTGVEDITGLEYSIAFDGGFILLPLGKITNGIIDIPAGEEETVKAFVLGFGKTIITVTACPEEKTATGTVFLIFVLGVN